MSDTALSSVCPSPCPCVTVVAEEAQPMGAGGILHSDCNKVLFCPSTGNTYGAGRGWVPHSIIWGGEALQSSSISLGCCTSVWNHVSPERLSAAPNWCGFSTFFFGVLFFFLLFFSGCCSKKNPHPHLRDQVQTDNSLRASYQLYFIQISRVGDRQGKEKGFSL